MVLPDSDDVSRVSPYSGSWTEGHWFHLRGYHPVSPTFPDCSIINNFGNSNVQSYNPNEQAHWFGLFPVRSPLLRESKISFCSCGYWDVSVPHVYLYTAMNSLYSNSRLKLLGFPIRKSPDQSLRTAPRSISVLVPSFIGFQCQGIHHAPFLT